ncbi:MAG TPA: orotidine-5'-phosphate decarboxylase [Opitutaceae bacterium]|nr:orotidine-5'-phosphate decarboxylase [Opitutaceae bacterium]
MPLSFKQKISNATAKADSLLCVGLDPELARLPRHIAAMKEPFFEFNRAIIDATAASANSYKFQVAHYAAEGREGELEKSIAYLKSAHPHVPVILDGKRGDIGSTAERYAIECFERYNADAATVNPYLGADSVLPFAKWADRGVIVLCRTSNPSAREIQDLRVDGRAMFEVIADLATKSWNANKNISLVVGGTYPRDLATLRAQCGDDMMFLVPGVGAQGADVNDVVKAGQNTAGTGLMINSSRGIIYASIGEDFAAASKAAAESTRTEINKARSAAAAA